MSDTVLGYRSLRDVRGPLLAWLQARAAAAPRVAPLPGP